MATVTAQRLFSCSISTPCSFLFQSKAIGDDEEELGGYVATEEFLRLRDASTCGKMQVGRF